jgi:hypothetical protein
MDLPSQIIRAPDWEDRLSTYLDRVSEEPFAWGSHDCALFAAGAVRAMSGIDPAAAFRDQYDTREGSAAALREHGAGTLLKTVSAWFGPSKHVSQAKRGDVVMRDRTTLGICVGAYSYFVGEEHGQHGLVAIPTADCSRAFTVLFEATSNAEGR